MNEELRPNTFLKDFTKALRHEYGVGQEENRQAFMHAARETARFSC